MKSRASHATALMGHERMIVSPGHTYVGRGKSDGMPIVIIPLLGENNFVNHLLLIHIIYNETLTLSEKINVLGYRYHDIRNLVTEFNLPWRDEYLAHFSLEDLFSDSVEGLSGQIKSQFGKNKLYNANPRPMLFKIVYSFALTKVIAPSLITKIDRI